MSHPAIEEDEGLGERLLGFIAHYGSNQVAKDRAMVNLYEEARNKGLTGANEDRYINDRFKEACENESMKFKNELMRKVSA